MASNNIRVLLKYLY
uniref:Uncharacterized protein n=1 Tax=Rhizophora mucronata TaxID=61149 RepID=A0A2P2PXC6_RHIMU